MPFSTLPLIQSGYQLKPEHSGGARSQESESSSCLTSDFCIPSLLDCPALSWSPSRLRFSILHKQCVRLIHDGTLPTSTGYSSPPHLLPSAFYLLPSTFYLLPSTFCLLPSAFYLPPGELLAPSRINPSPAMPRRAIAPIQAQFSNSPQSIL